MASIRKRGNRWYVEVRLKSGRQSKSFDSKLEAQAWAVEKEMQLGRGAGIVRGKTLEDAFRRYSDEVSPTKKGQRLEVVRLKKLGRADIAGVMLCDLTAADIERWVAQELQRIKSSSVNRDLNLLSSVIETARKKWRWIESNPVRDVERPRDPPPRDRRLSESEIDRILDALGYDESGEVVAQRHEIAVAFLFALETAMRQGEIWGLDWSRVDLQQRYLTLTDTKNGTSRDVPLSKRAVVLLEKLCPRSSGRVFKYNQQSCGTIFRRSLKLAGIENLTFHDTRHEALTRLARKLDVLDLARMVGHRDPRSLMIYYNATASEIASRLD